MIVRTAEDTTPDRVGCNLCILGDPHWLAVDKKLKTIERCLLNTVLVIVTDLYEIIIIGYRLI